MRHLVDTPSDRKRFCKHEFKIVFPQGSRTPVEVCAKCNKTRTPKVKNQTLIPYLQKSTSKKSAILAYQQSILVGVAAYVELFKSLENWNIIEHDGWRLIANKSKYNWCGLWMTLGCLNSKLHQLLGKGNRVYIKQFALCCYRASCSVCYLQWIWRDADRATKRLAKYPERRGRDPLHIMLLPPPSQRHLSYEKLKDRTMEILKKTQWEGGNLIFHPAKLDKIKLRWYHAPHFHLLGYGTRSDIEKAFGMYHWYVKIAEEERESVFKTMCYLLSHCGIRKGNHAVIWIGKLSYRKMKVEKENKITCCPICEGKFGQVSHDGPHPIVTPEKPYQGLVDDDGKWHLT